MKCMFRIQRMEDKNRNESEFRSQENNANWNDGKEPSDSADKIEMKPWRDVLIDTNDPQGWKRKFQMVVNHTEQREAEATNDKEEASKEKKIDPELVDDRGVDIENRGVVMLWEEEHVILEEPRASCEKIKAISNDTNEVKNKCWSMNGIWDEVSFTADDTDREEDWEDDDRRDFIRGLSNQCNCL